MIYLYTGKIGDGKTYHVVRNELVPAIKARRKVYTNIDMEPENVRALAFYCGLRVDEVDIERIGEGADGAAKVRELLTLDENDKENSCKLKRGSVVILDEAQMIYDARESKDTPKGFLTLLEWHRHLGLDFVFITQNYKRCDSVIARLCNEALQVKNLKFLSGLMGHRYVLHHRQTPGDAVVATTKGTLEPQYFRFYKSMSATGVRTHESQGFLTAGRVVPLVLLAAFVVYRFASHGVIVKPAVAKETRTASEIAPLRSDVGQLRDALAPLPRRCEKRLEVGRATITFRGKTEMLERPREVTVCEGPLETMTPAPASAAPSWAGQFKRAQ